MTTPCDAPPSEHTTMKTWLTRFAALTVALGCLVSLRAQTSIQIDGLSTARGKAVRVPFEQMYPPASTYAVVVRGDLPTVPAKGAREPDFPVEIDDTGWKGPGSMFRAKPVGNLAPGEVMKVERVEYSKDHIDLRLVSVDPHEIVVDPGRPDRNRHEQVATLLTVPHDAGIAQIIQRADAYVRLFASLDAAREYARTLREPQPQHRFTLAVVRRDGILVPIANYDNGHWFRRWPVPANERDVPIDLGQVPAEWWGIEGPTAKWTLWTPDGRSRPLQVTAPLAFGAHCLMNVGLETDYRSLLPRPPLDQHHYPKDGLATTGTPPIDRVSVMTADNSWAAFERLVQPQVERLEARLGVRLPLSLATTPVKLEVLCIADGPTPGTHTAYFEATKRYRLADGTGPNPCGPVTFAAGWVHREADGRGTLYPTARTQASDCSMWDVDFGVPLGVIRVDGETIWVMEMSRWGGERYDLVRVTATTTSVILSVPGGSCRSIGN